MRMSEPLRVTTTECTIISLSLDSTFRGVVFVARRITRAVMVGHFVVRCVINPLASKAAMLAMDLSQVIVTIAVLGVSIAAVMLFVILGKSFLYYESAAVRLWLNSYVASDTIWGGVRGLGGWLSNSDQQWLHITPRKRADVVASLCLT